jgi:hypothetical protein
VDVSVAPPVAVPRREPDAPQRADHAPNWAPAAPAYAEVDGAAAGVRGLRAAVGAGVGALGCVEHAAAPDEATRGPQHPDGADVERHPAPDSAVARSHDADHAEATAGEPLERRLAGDAARIEPGVAEPTLPGRIPGHRLPAEVAVDGNADAPPAQLPLHAPDTPDGAARPAVSRAVLVELRRDQQPLHVDRRPSRRLLARRRRRRASGQQDRGDRRTSGDRRDGTPQCAAH